MGDGGRLDGRVAIVTGGARGQGEAEARQLANEGALVAVADRLEERGRAVAEDIGAAARFVSLDVSREEAWEEAVAATVRHFGKLDVLVNNAGIAHLAPITETTLRAYEKQVAVNQIGVFLGMRTVIPHMIEAGRGSIVNICSLAAMRGHVNMVAYTAAKYAVRGMTQVAARELAPFNIRANALFPGLIDTPLARGPQYSHGEFESLAEEIPIGRIGLPQDMANTVAFFASEESAYITGAEVVVDGGLSTCGIELEPPR